MIVPVSVMMREVWPSCRTCNKPAAYSEVKPDFDRLGLYVGHTAPEAFYCDEHSPRDGLIRLQCSDSAFDCKDRDCGPDHCEYPTCRSD